MATDLDINQLKANLNNMHPGLSKLIDLVDDESKLNDIKELEGVISKVLNQNRSITSNTENQRSEDIYYVPKAESVKSDEFSQVDIPQNPRLGENSYGSPHNDSYCSESANTKGPHEEKLRVIRQRNPFGYTPCMVSNKKNQMIGVSFDWRRLSFYLTVWSPDCQLLSATYLDRKNSGTFGGGYFFMDDDENTIVGTQKTLQCYDTKHVMPESGSLHNNHLETVWETEDLVKHFFGKDSTNALYSAMPVWTHEKRNLYYVLFAGDYSLSSGKYQAPAAMGVVEVVKGPILGKYRTITHGLCTFDNEWNNNTFSVDETGAYFVTNVVGKCDQNAKSFGHLRKVSFDTKSNKLSESFKSRYESCEYLKEGQKNIGSGTTPTLIDTSDGRKLVAITDNADPQLNVLTYDRMTGKKVSETPVFAPMRSADEASLIGVEDVLIVENNYGHELTYPGSQLTPIEPGMSRIDLASEKKKLISRKEDASTTWTDERTSFLAMSMLARKTGIIFAHTADWSGDASATQGAMYYVSAIDAYTGRTIWRMPLGRGVEFCHDYGGVYFNREGNLYIGTANYMCSVQNERSIL